MTVIYRPSNYNFPDHVRGDTFNGVVFTVLVNASPVDFTNAILTMDLRPLGGGDVVKTFTTIDSGGLTIQDPPTSGKFSLDQQIIDLPSATYEYDIEMDFSNGVVKTYIGGTWTILQDVTHGTETN